MKRNIAIALILSLFLSSCATYRDPQGNVEITDSICSSGACPLLIIAMFTGLGVAVANAGN